MRASPWPLGLPLPRGTEGTIWPTWGCSRLSPLPPQAPSFITARRGWGGDPQPGELCLGGGQCLGLQICAQGQCLGGAVPGGSHRTFLYLSSPASCSY